MYESRMQLGHVGPEHSGRLVMECFPFPPNYASPPLQGPLCEMSVNEKTVRGCIGSSGNVRVYVWIRSISLVMEYGETCIPGRMDDLHKSLTVALREALV
jgi:hypothetical protein